MRTYFVRATVWMAVLFLGMAVLPGAGLAAGTPAVKQKVELLFVQNSRGVAIDKDKGTLTLKGVSPTTLWFSDRPVRMAGHFNMKEYLATWGEGAESFRTDPPNATLSVFEQGQDDLLDVVVKLQNPRLQGDDLIYDITLIEGQLPKKSGPASLFIDIFGIWRRTARRAVWIGAAATTAAVATTAASAAAVAASHPTTVVVKETPPPPPPAPAAAAPAATNTQAAAMAKLKELKSMQKQGLITEAQYQAESQKLLNQLVE